MNFSVKTFSTALTYFQYMLFKKGVYNPCEHTDHGTFFPSMPKRNTKESNFLGRLVKYRRKDGHYCGKNRRFGALRFVAMTKTCLAQASRRAHRNGIGPHRLLLEEHSAVKPSIVTVNPTRRDGYPCICILLQRKECLCKCSVACLFLAVKSVRREGEAP